MNKFIFVAVLCIAVVLQSNGQDKKQKDNPDEQITVNKKYDANGNLIQFDSTYVHQWSSDSTLNFDFDHNFDFGDNFPDMFDNSMIDSMIQHFGIAHHFNFSPFDDDDFFGQFNGSLPDSLLNNLHSFKDSLYQYHNGPQGQVPDIFNAPDLDRWRQQLQNQLRQLNEFTPQFQNEEQRKEWEELMKKQQKEREELIQKWGSDKKL